jgi:ubiquinone/menaquinone biosynthesis C-methylase UbiE
VPRIIEPEWMDYAPIEEAAHSLRDLDRINRWLGGWSTLRSLLRRAGADTAGTFSFLDVGAGSAAAARRVHGWYPRARTVSLDYRWEHLAQGSGLRVAGDAFRLPLRDRSVDFVSSCLFLHHFEDEQVTSLFREARRVARRAVLAVDLERGPLAENFIPWTRPLFKWHAITAHDAPVSVRAGFRREELAQLARAAGWERVEVRVHRPWGRLSLIAQ